MGKIGWLTERARAIRQSQGVFGLARRSISFALEPVFWRRTFYLYERTVQSIPASYEIHYKPNIKNLSFKIVTSPKEAEEFEAEGFMFRSYPTFDNKKLRFYWKVMGEGAIACCVFAGHDLASIQFIIPTRKAMKNVTYYRTKVDFSHGETYIQSLWTNPKYRRKGLYKYNTFFNMDQFLLSAGINTVRSTFWNQNEIGQHLAISVGARQYAKAMVTRFLWWKFWEGESPIAHDDPKSQTAVSI